MTTYYVGPGGNNANNGTSWALRKLTLNGAEDIPVAAADTVYVGPGTYCESLTVDVSGSAGSPVTYIGDYTGANTDGVGGVVRITGSDNDQTATRASCITAASKHYRSFTGFTFDTTTSHLITTATAVNNWIVDKCLLFVPYNTMGMQFYGTLSNMTIRNCGFVANTAAGSQSLRLGQTVQDSSGNAIENCILIGGGYGVICYASGTTIRNCKALLSGTGYYADTNGGAQIVTLNNSLASWCAVAMQGQTTGDLIENYNNIWACTTARTNVDVGANSLAYPPLFDTRSFFEMVNGGKVATPFDLSAASQLLNVAGTSPTTTDMRGTAVIGAQREWGPLEYDTTLILPALAEVTEAGGGTYHEPSVGEVLDSAVYGPASATSGTYHEPSVGEVIDTAVFGPASGTSGTFAAPTEAQVEAGVGFGEDGTEFEGELVAGGGVAPFSPLIGYLGG